jgi:hypothetical protein
MLPIRHEPIQGAPWRDGDRHPGGPSEPDEIRKLTIVAQHQNPGEGSGACPQRLSDGMKAAEDLGALIASTGWCHPADPRS